MTGYKRLYTTQDIWAASYLELFGIPLVGCRLAQDGRAEWCFDNENDAAWQTGMEFRTEATAAVPILAYRAAYRRMAREADAARGGTRYGQGRDEHAA